MQISSRRGIIIIGATKEKYFDGFQRYNKEKWKKGGLLALEDET